jgi:hypothetical protein
MYFEENAAYWELDEITGWWLYVYNHRS